MKGKHHITVATDRVRYEFDIKRNITIIQGDSATGKTTLVDLLRQYSQMGENSGVRVQSDKRSIVYGGTNDNWKPVIETESDSIVFIDEDYDFIFQKEFAEVIRYTGNYYVLITRRPIRTLPYSSAEIYGIRSSGKYNFPQQIYNEFYPIYAEEYSNEKVRTLLLVEDKNSGFQFWEKVNGAELCISAEGNSGVIAKVAELKDNDIATTVIADGAAFGAYIEGLLSVADLRKNVSVYLPESFEWLILKSGIIEKAEISTILSEPEQYIESADFFNWEQYFTDLLSKLTADDPVMRYKKSELKPYYLQKRSIQMILSVLPKDLQETLDPFYRPAN